MRLPFKLSLMIASMAITVVAAFATEVSANSDPAVIKAFIEYLQKQPNSSVDQLYAQAQAYYWLKEYEKSSLILSNALASKRTPAIFALRAANYKYLRRYPEALKDCDEAIRMGYGKADIYSLRSLVKLNLNDFAGANKDAAVALAAQADDPVGNYVKGNLEYRSGRLDSAVKYLSKSLDKDPGDAATYQLRGFVLDKLGRRQEAKLDLEKAKSKGLE